jgi:hypothetical protein
VPVDPVPVFGFGLDPGAGRPDGAGMVETEREDEAYPPPFFCRGCCATANSLDVDELKILHLVPPDEDSAVKQLDGTTVVEDEVACVWIDLDASGHE